MKVVHVKRSLEDQIAFLKEQLKDLTRSYEDTTLITNYITRLYTVMPSNGLQVEHGKWANKAAEIANKINDINAELLILDL